MQQKSYTADKSHEGDFFELAAARRSRRETAEKPVSERESALKWQERVANLVQQQEGGR